MRLLALCLLLAGCGYEKPKPVCVSTDFTEEQRAAIGDAADEWCERVGACVTLREDTCRHRRGYDAAFVPAPADWTGKAGHWDGWNMLIDVRYGSASTWVQFVALHEMGHMLGLPDVHEDSVMGSSPWHLRTSDVELYEQHGND